mmetsp:Transcript_17765/g.30620  ORF Transcript_17765/g.30620 Transcript_17765/m.30620 type:complete len:345 (+) Transcript_17765:64-1098(+)|eukprot:CAMPEP_0196661236 /NCGR_PEP_ID=MMETSP1086-20130531/43357_1 /TAXON_ID=77921 /ORGANISM="Cyanoptyche  gloeocystis , Strain SAG4.97" /LENGTH=344 /DNA_ID=CAMNT_0041996043 /DNA_START=64 /DNA_END=1098 /DNA_ORIENTATION=+
MAERDGYVGNAADVQRIARLSKAREKERQNFEERKKKIVEDNNAGVKTISEKFGSSASATFEQQFVKETIGLVTKEDFKRKRETIEELQVAQAEKERKEAAAKRAAEKKKREDEVKKKAAPKLSFSLEEESDEENGEPSADDRSESGRSTDSNSRKKKISKDPNVDTSFLPDRDREALERQEIERLKQEYLLKQQREKAEMIEVTYSYWDGTGHRRVTQVNKGTTMAKFLEQIKRELSDEFRELRSCPVDNLLYVKEDLIIPHHYSFHDLIVSKARGKSGPLFHFDVHEDVRTMADARIEKDESHAGKVVERHWYEKNKHIFPASRWEVYDPARKFEKYTIHGA